MPSGGSPASPQRSSFVVAEFSEGRCAIFRRMPYPAKDVPLLYITAIVKLEYAPFLFVAEPDVTEETTKI